MGLWVSLSPQTLPAATSEFPAATPRLFLLQEVMFKTVKYTESVNSLEMFLKGDYMVKTEQAQARLGFNEHNMLIIGFVYHEALLRDHDD